MKKIISLILCIALVISVFVGSVYADDNNGTGSEVVTRWMNTFEVTASVLNVRSGPGLSYSIVGQIYQGDIGFLYDSREIVKDGYTWVPICNSNGGLYGWIAKEYIVIIG